MADTTNAEYCPQCASLIGDFGCLSCGWLEELHSTDVDFELDTTLEIDGVEYRIERLHRSVMGGRRYIGLDPNNENVELLIASSSGPIDARLARQKIAPEYFPELACRCQDDQYEVAVFKLGKGKTLIAQLARAKSNRAINDCADLAESIAVPFSTYVCGLHQRKLTLGTHDPSEVWIREDGSMLLLDVLLVEESEYDGPVTLTNGFSPPEAYGRCGGRFTKSADVFYLGMILYHVLARVSVPSKVGLLTDRIPSPGLFHPRVHAELSAVARRAISLTPTHRYADGETFKDALKWSLKVERLRNQHTQQPIRLEVASETHIGLLKQRYCAQNQDSSFTSWDPSDSRGLFVVSDGVSVSEFGSGDQASEIVCDSAQALWSSLENQALFSADETLGALDSTMDVAAEFQLSPLPIGTAARNRLLGDMLDAANATIGVRIQSSLPRSMIHPEGIMAATAVCCVIENARMTYCSIGDSRIYLVRDGHLSTLSYEHNYANRLIVNGKDYDEALRAPNGAALVRCVGEFEFDEDHRLVPVPLKPDFGEIFLLSGDTVILCSDGIPDYIASSEEQAEAVIIKLTESAPSSAHLAYDLVVAANRGGGGDNLTCTVLKVF